LTAHLPRIALVGGDEPLAEAILRELEDRDLEVGEILPLGLEESDSMVSHRGRDLPVMDLAGFDWQLADVVIVASHAAAARRRAESASQAGKVVLDPANPTGAAIALGRVLAAITREFGLTAAHVSLNLPVSHHGMAAIEELSGQTRALFALESTEPGLLPPRIAFNMIPDSVDSAGRGVSQFEQRVEVDVRALLDAPSLPVMLLACWVPVFYGYSASLHVVCERPLDPSLLRALLAGTRGITVMDEAIPGGVPTPATDAQDSVDVFVGRLRVGEQDARQASLWLVFDGLRLEAVRTVDALENLIETTQNSVLT